MADSLEQKAVGFPTFGGLRLDQSLDEVGANASIYEHDIDRDGSVGRFRSRDGFQKLNASAASGEYKGLYPHSAARLLAVKRIKSTEVKLVAMDKEGSEKTSIALAETEAPSTFAATGNNAGSFTFFRSNTSAQKVVQFDGTTFTEPKATIENTNSETGEKEAPKGEKEMPKARHMLYWPDANALVHANTGSTGGPNGASSSNSHVWFSKPGSFLAYEESAFIRLGVGDGEEITGICVYGSQLYVFKETRFWVVSPPSSNSFGQPVFSFREVTLGQGSRIRQVLTEKLKETSDRICWASQDGVFFCTTDGIYVTTGGAPQKISFQLKPLEETVPFEGPMAEFLNGSTESFRWPGTGIQVLGKRLFVKRYEFMFVYDLSVQVWTCWKMPCVSFCIWTGLTGGGTESSGEKSSSTAATSGVVAWTNPNNAKTKDETYATSKLELPNFETGKLTLTNFGSVVPTGVTIIGIQVTLWAKVTTISGGPRVLASRMALLREGTESSNLGASGTIPFGGIAGTETAYTFGGPETLWGLTWTPAQLNAATSGLVLQLNNASASGVCTVEVDAALITAYYLTAESSSGVRPRMFCSQSKTVFWNGPSAVEEATFPGWAWQSGLYDLGSEDEKELVRAKLWGAGTIELATSKDFKEVTKRKTYTMGEETTQKVQNVTDKATLFSHRFSGSGKASVQRFVRYLRTTATSGSQSDPS